MSTKTNLLPPVEDQEGLPTPARHRSDVRAHQEGAHVNESSEPFGIPEESDVYDTGLYEKPLEAEERKDAEATSEGDVTEPDLPKDFPELTAHYELVRRSSEAMDSGPRPWDSMFHNPSSRRSYPVSGMAVARLDTPDQTEPVETAGACAGRPAIPPELDVLPVRPAAPTPARPRYESAAQMSNIALSKELFEGFSGSIGRPDEETCQMRIDELPAPPVRRVAGKPVDGRFLGWMFAVGVVGLLILVALAFRFESTRDTAQRSDVPVRKAVLVTGALPEQEPLPAAGFDAQAIHLEAISEPPERAVHRPRAGGTP